MKMWPWKILPCDSDGWAKRAFSPAEYFWIIRSYIAFSELARMDLSCIQLESEMHLDAVVWFSNSIARPTNYHVKRAYFLASLTFVLTIARTAEARFTHTRLCTIASFFFYRSSLRVFFPAHARKSWVSMDEETRWQLHKVDLHSRSIKVHVHGELVFPIFPQNYNLRDKAASQSHSPHFDQNFLSSLNIEALPNKLVYYVILWCNFRFSWHNRWMFVFRRRKRKK